MTMQLIDIAAYTVGTIYSLYITLSAFMSAFPHCVTRPINTIWIIGKWISVLDPFLIALRATMRHDFGPLHVVYITVTLVAWWIYRNAGDDDTWKKKLKESATEKIEQIENRLVVVPAEAPA